MSEQNDATQRARWYLARRAAESGVEEAKTWAEEIAALKVENAELRTQVQIWNETNVILWEEKRALEEQVKQLLADKWDYSAMRNPETFPSNALKHSR